MDEFIKVLKSNDQLIMKEYILHNGKKPKVIAPFYFEKKEDNKDDSNKGTRAKNNE